MVTAAIFNGGWNRRTQYWKGITPAKFDLIWFSGFREDISCSQNLSSFRFIIKQQWTIEEISIFSNSSHLEWRMGLSDTILKGTHQGTIPVRFGLIWFSGFRGEDLNVIFYQNMPNLHNRYKSAERKISQKNSGIYVKLLLAM